MMRRTIATLIAAALITPAVAAAAQPRHARDVARMQCNAERKLLGVKGFRLKYGTPNAFRKCVKAHLPSDRQAAAACRAERKQIGAVAFRKRYGGPVPLNRCIKEQTAP